MKKLIYLLVPAIVMTFSGCDTDDDSPGLMKLDGAKLRVTFTAPGKLQEDMVYPDPCSISGWPA